MENFQTMLFYTSLFPSKSLRKRRLAPTNIYHADTNTYSSLLLDRFWSQFEQCKLFLVQYTSLQNTSWDFLCTWSQTKCPKWSCLDSLKLNSLYSFLFLFVWTFFLIYSSPYSLLLPISEADMGYCITYASRQTPTSYRLLPTYYKCLLFSMQQVPAKSIVQKLCSIQMDFTNTVL